MKLVDNIINKFGSDKILHFLVGGYLTGLCGLFGWIGLVVGFVVTMLLEFAKEKWFDTVFDKKDFIATLLGSLFTVIIYVISVIL